MVNIEVTVESIKKEDRSKSERDNKTHIIKDSTLKSYLLHP